MSNLNNMYKSCPPLMSDGRSSVLTDYKMKNDTFFEMKGKYTSSYDFRDNLQNVGLPNETKYNVCGTVPFGDVTLSSKIILGDNSPINLNDSYKLLLSK
jgi:hypothetical protein